MPPAYLLTIQLLIKPVAAMYLHTVYKCSTTKTIQRDLIPKLKLSVRTAAMNGGVGLISLSQGAWVGPQTILPTHTE